MDALGPWHVLIVVAVFVVLFGAKRLPDAARSLGRSARVFKTEIKGLHDDEETADPASQNAVALPAGPQRASAAQSRAAAKSPAA